jgi:regulator of protease activity HflC (stomatin/prohibitin superfamily)
MKTKIFLIAILAVVLLGVKVINAEGEYQAATKLAEASKIIEKQPTALQLRYLQTMNEMATESNSTTIFPIPIELFKPFVGTYSKD